MTTSEKQQTASCSALKEAHSRITYSNITINFLFCSVVLQRNFFFNKIIGPKYYWIILLFSCEGFYFSNQDDEEYSQLWKNFWWIVRSVVKTRVRGKFCVWNATENTQLCLELIQDINESMNTKRFLSFINRNYTKRLKTTSLNSDILIYVSEKSKKFIELKSQLLIGDF